MLYMHMDAAATTAAGVPLVDTTLPDLGKVSSRPPPLHMMAPKNAQMSNKGPVGYPRPEKMTKLTALVGQLCSIQSSWITETGRRDAVRGTEEGITSMSGDGASDAR